MAGTQNQTTHPLQEYNDLLEKFKGWIVPLGLTLGFTYEHISHDTGFSGAQIQLNKEWSSDTSIFSKASPMISIMGNFHEPLTRYKFAAIATSILIHQHLTQDTRFNHMTDIDEIDHTLFGPIIWWANNISKLPIIGRSKYTGAEFKKFEILHAAAEDKRTVEPTLLTDFPNEDWKQDLNDPSTIGVPEAFKSPNADTWRNVSLQEDLEHFKDVVGSSFNPKIWGHVFQKQLYLACGISGLDTITLPMQHTPVGYLHRNPETNRLELVHGGQLSFAKVYSTGLVGLGLYLMNLSGKFTEVNFDHIDILHSFADVEEIQNSRELSYKHIILGHAIYWAMQFTSNSIFKDFLPRSLTAIWLRYHRNHNHRQWWEN